MSRSTISLLVFLPSTERQYLLFHYLIAVLQLSILLSRCSATQHVPALSLRALTASSRQKTCHAAFLGDRPPEREEGYELTVQRKGGDAFPSARIVFRLG